MSNQEEPKNFENEPTEEPKEELAVEELDQVVGGVLPGMISSSPQPQQPQQPPSIIAILIG